MKSESPLRLLLLLATLFGIAATAFTRPAAAEPRPGFGVEPTVQASWIAGLPLSFLENDAQLDPRVAFHVPGRDKQIYFTQKGITFLLTPGRKAAGRPVQSWAVKTTFLDADEDVRLHGLNPADVPLYRWKGARQGGEPDVDAAVAKAYQGIRYDGLWPGIDLALTLDGKQLKYEFHVAPGADPSQIRWAYEGAETSITTDGGLQIATPVAGFIDGRPWAFQRNGDTVQRVEAAYRLGRPTADQPTAAVGESRGKKAPPQVVLVGNATSEKGRSAVYGFQLGPYDLTKPLVIDPAVLVYAGFLGGSGADTAEGITIDEDGNAYLVGTTRSTEAEFPVVAGSRTHLAGSTDVFVAKLDPSGTKLLFAGYLGGSGLDEGADIAIDSQRNIYVTGLTWSEDFPVVVGPDLSHNGRMDAFVAKIAPDGSEVLYSGFLGGVQQEEGMGIAVDRDGNAYLAGRTQSPAATFPAIGGPDLTYNGGNADGFVAKVNADGSALVYAGYIGGALFDIASAIAVDRDGHAYLTGYTGSNQESFPVSGGPMQTWSGSDDAFLAKVTPDGTGLVYSGFLGGLGAERGADIALDDSGNIYLAGFTTSRASSSLPITVGPSVELSGQRDALVAKIGPDGSEILYAGYIGGEADDRATSIAIDGLGNAYVGGTTLSEHTSFPVLAGPDLTYRGGSEGFVAKVAASGAGLHYAGYIGGFGNESVNDVAVDRDGLAYVAGSSTTPNPKFPIVGPDLTPNGLGDAFVAKIGATILAEGGVVNAASFAPGAIAPGEIVSLFGSGMGPATGEVGRLDSLGRVATELAGVEVFFDGVPAPLFFVRADQINAQAPYSLDGKSETEVQVRFQGRASEVVEFAVAPSTPGIFAFLNNPERAVVFNQDGTVNSQTNPALRGETIVFFATGEGQTIPPGIDGQLAPEDLARLPRPELPVTVTIGRRDAHVSFAGSAPGFSGLLQVNARVPFDLGANTDLVLEIGEARSQRDVSLFAR